MTPEILEVAFKGNKSRPYFNPKDIKVKPGDFVIVEAEKGVALGRVNKVGRLVTLSNIKGEPKKLIRKAAEDDLEKLRQNREREEQAALIARQMIQKHHLNMKLVDVEFQYDQNKLTFYFTSEKRVDFRELVKDLAAKYRTRIELRQIGVRDEAGRLSGLGICGKPLCCSTFKCNFEPVTTQYAKDQHLPLNPGKLTGICGRLKCCLVFESKLYESSKKNFPALESRIVTSRGKAYVDKIDIFRDMIYIRYAADQEIEEISLERYKHLMAAQKQKN